MSNTINIYCDESCHLERDQIDVMVLGAVWAEIDAAKIAARQLIELKKRHGLRPTFDLKWVAVSPAKLPFYLDVVDYFFDNRELSFRAVVIPDKKLLDHQSFSQTHGDWYYKMFYLLLNQVVRHHNQYRIYFDIKDTWSQRRENKLHEIMCGKFHDEGRQIVQRIQHVRSHEVQLLQLDDLLLGAIGYANRQLSSSAAKLKVIERIKDRAGFPLTGSTLRSEKKFNVFMWKAKEKSL